ncbi:MAG: insulinase family protein [Lewinellaceae bacterium]|nr:insulinase family protein [Lewinellaceae bacterium]
MKKILLFSLMVAGFFMACTPKTGEKTMATTPAKVEKGQAPVIPIPTGDVRKNAPVPGSAPKIQIGKSEAFTLDNGLKVIVVENHKLPSVSYRVFVDYDPVLENDAAGYVNMTGELLTKGTLTRSKAQIDEAVDFIGASLSSDANGVSGSCLSKHSDKLLTLMSDVLLNPTFPEEELAKAKTRTESALANSKDDANSIANNVGSALRYGKGHPYGEVMTEATLGKISLDQIRSHYNTYFKPNIAYLVVVGDITKAQAEQYAKKYFGKWQKAEVPKHEYGVPAPPDQTEVDFVNKPGAVQSVLQITYPVELRPGQPDVIRARVMNAILGGYFNSRVNANLREGHGYTYGARTALNPDNLVGSFSGTASVRNEVTDSSVIEFMKELNKLRDEKVPAEELQLVKNVLTGQFSQSLEQPGTVAGFALSTARYNLPADYYEKYIEVLQSVSADEIQMMAKKYVRPDHAHILVVGNRDDVAKSLAQFAADGKIKYFDIYGNPDNSANMAIPAGVTAETIITDYINAIGGTSKLAALKDLEFVGTMKGAGPPITFKTLKKDNTKAVVEVSMSGQVLSKQIFDGEKGIEYGMGGASRPIEGEGLLDMKEQALFCKEAKYLEGSYKLTLKGVEVVNGAIAYVMEIERADGKNQRSITTSAPVSNSGSLPCRKVRKAQ